MALTRFRTSSHSLLIETGRHNGTPRDERICKSCNTKQIESEYHFLLVCPFYRDIRAKYFTPYLCRWPNIHKFETLFNIEKCYQQRCKIYLFCFKETYLSQRMRFWYLSHRRPAKAQVSLRIRAVCQSLRCSHT